MPNPGGGVLTKRRIGSLEDELWATGGILLQIVVNAQELRKSVALA